MAVAAQDRKRTSSDLKSWLDEVAAYDKEFQDWEARGGKILDRYRDKRTDSRNGGARFNILWSNVQTLVPACFARVPQPDVSRRFRDNDPVGRVASMILERALEFEIHHHIDYTEALEASLYDRFLPGRAIVWVRYEPKVGPADDVEITEDEEDEAYEQLESECTPVDYVHWKDFGHSLARSWAEVNRVWRKVYLRRAQLVERFGDIGKTIALDTAPEEIRKSKGYNPRLETACIYEGWDKEAGEVVWFTKTVKDFLDRKDDPLGLEGFFPCPKPLYATLTTDSLVPTPDYALYQDQAISLDTLADRIDGLVSALKVTGVYDATQPALRRLFTEGNNNNLIPVNNWMAFAEKNGIAGAVDIADIAPIAAALAQAYEAFGNIKQQIDEITGVADIIRGQSLAAETATATAIKGQYAGLRLRCYQQDFAEYATEILRIKAQIMCQHYQPQTLLEISGAMQLQPVDQQYLGPALQMLKNSVLRDFRIEIAADSLVELDELQEKQARTEFLTAVGGFLNQALPIVQAEPASLPLVLEMLKFGVTGFKVGKQLEGMFDDFAQKAQQQALQPKPPDPKVLQQNTQLQVAQIKAQSEQQRSQADVATAIAKSQAAQAQAAAKVVQSRQQLMFPPTVQ